MKSPKVLRLLFFAGLVFLVIFLRLPSLQIPFDMDGGDHAYHARLILRGEPLYSSHHPGHHLPGVYYTYWLAFRLLGDSTWSVKLLLIPWTILTAYLIYLVGLRLDGNAVGILAAIFYSILSSHKLLKGLTAETELFANLPITAAILLSIEFMINKPKNWKFIFIGVLNAIAFLYKAVFLSPLIVALFMVVASVWLDREGKNALKTVFKRIGWMMLGFSGFTLVVVAYFASLGLLDRLLLVFSLGTGYVDDTSNQVNFIFIPVLPLFVLGINNVILVLLSLGACYRFFKENRLKSAVDSSFKLIGFGIIVWYLLSILIAGLTRRLWHHYSLIVIPPLSLLAAWEIVQLIKKRVVQRPLAQRRSAVLPVVGLLIAALLISAGTNYKIYYSYWRFQSGVADFAEFLESAGPNGADLRLLTTAEYIQARTTADDFIYSWSNNAQIYYLTDRRAPIDMIWPIYAQATGPYQRIFSPRTKYILVGESNTAITPGWLYQELEKSYRLETVIGDQEIYRRIDE